MIRVVSYGEASSTHVYNDDGHEIKGIQRIRMKIDPFNYVIAEIKYILPIVDCVAVETISKKHLRELANAMGYDLVEIKKHESNKVRKSLP